MPWGGGGGGGWYGGGAGLLFGTGGGGSSYTDPSITSIIHTQGVNDGDGYMVIYWQAPPLLLRSFSPASGSCGTSITITGSCFTQVLAVSFGGKPAKPFTVINSQILEAQVDTGSSGNVSVTTNSGTSILPGFVYTDRTLMVSSNSPVCTGEIIQLTATVSGVNYQRIGLFSEGFNGANNWQVENATSAGWYISPDNSPDGYHSNDRTPYYLTFPTYGVSQRSTQLVSPAFSTIGQSVVNIDFAHAFSPSSTFTSGKVEVSTDLVNWTLLKQYTSNDTQIWGCCFEYESIPLIAAFFDKPAVYLRFNFYAESYYGGWAIDNVQISNVHQVEVASIVWTPVTGLFTDEAALNPYTGVAIYNVYAKPVDSGNYTYTATASSGDCNTASGNALVTVKPLTDKGYFYRTISTGNWNNAAIWEVSADDVSFSIACMPPGAGAKSITIRNGNVVTVTAHTAASKTIIETGATLHMNQGVVVTIE